MKLTSFIFSSLIALASFTGCDSAETQPDAQAQPNGCAICGEGTICVQRYGGTCQAEDDGDVTCVTTALVCAPNTCSDECEAALCGGAPYQCDTRTACGNEIDGSFTCYGP